MTRERGSVTVLVVGVGALACVLALAVARLGSVAAARARAESAADAAALAAATAGAIQEAPGAVIDAARRAAQANGARLIHCDCLGRYALVRVAVPLASKEFPRWLEASSRAEVGGLCPLCKARAGTSLSRIPLWVKESRQENPNNFGVITGPQRRSRASSK